MAANQIVKENVDLVDEKEGSHEVKPDQIAGQWTRLGQ